MKNRVKDKVWVVSLGCPRNLVDSEGILGGLAKKGYALASGIDKADIGIVNTCAFIEDARVESIDAILELIQLKKEGHLKKLLVYGCLPQRYKEQLKNELPEVDAFIGRVSLNHSPNILRMTPLYYAYVKICEGCLNRCSYCVIPKIKGRFTSLDMDSLLDRVSSLDRAKVAEVNIVGQDITGYGMDLYGAKKLPQLLDKMLKSTNNIVWFRLLYLYPNRISDELLELIGSQSRVCKYIDLPIQHINDRILKLMRRNTAKKEIVRLIAKIRKKIPQVAIRTSLIVGFPSETDKEFRELVDFIEEVKFDRLGVFIYSREEGTAAYDFEKQIPQKIKSQRLDTIMSKQQLISQEINNRLLGRTIDVLIEEEEKEAWPVTLENRRAYLGRSQYDAPEVDGTVYVNSSKKLKPGDFAKVKITDTLEYDLVGDAQA
ncbi:MAG: MiaB/RimO family radical SAM methylthiotransferase [Candidatus Omnitrophica bacterium]|nr:MiaB/RimO family radical SAM methylthiotransferase [Candidatus Omnitrophota bacterium]